MTFWQPTPLFAAGEQGAWYDPSDLSTMFQDVAGTMPVTAAGQSVARINDKSGRGNHATQAAAASRPLLVQGADGRFGLLFDGVDDFLEAPAFAWGTDAVTACIGLRKLSDAAAALGLTFGTTTSAGSWNLLAPGATGQPRFDFASRGSSALGLASRNNVTEASPRTRVQTGIGQTSTNTSTLRLDRGLFVQNSTTVQGAANYGPWPLGIGGSSLSALRLNGIVYQAVCVSRLLTTAQRDQLEAFVTIATTGIQGTVASTLPLAAAASGVAIAAGLIAASLPLAAAATGVTLAAGTIAPTLPLTANASGDIITAGAVASTLPLATQSAADILTAGTIAAELRPETGATGDIITAGTIAPTVPLTAAIAGDIITLGLVDALIGFAIEGTGDVFLPPTSPRQSFHVARESLRFTVQTEQRFFTVKRERAS